MKQQKKIDWMAVATWLEKHMIYRFGMMRSTIRSTSSSAKTD